MLININIQVKIFYKYSERRQIITLKEYKTQVGTDNQKHGGVCIQKYVIKILF